MILSQRVGGSWGTRRRRQTWERTLRRCRERQRQMQKKAEAERTRERGRERETRLSNQSSKQHHFSIGAVGVLLLFFVQLVSLCPLSLFSPLLDFLFLIPFDVVFPVSLVVFYFGGRMDVGRNTHITSHYIDRREGTKEAFHLHSFNMITYASHLHLHLHLISFLCSTTVMYVGFQQGTIIVSTVLGDRGGR